VETKDTHNPNLPWSRWKSLMWKHFTIAVSFLTIVRPPCTPSGEISPADLAKSFTWFPAVGFLLGLCSAAVAWQLQSAPPLLLAVVLTALLAILTRGLHLDGLADLADGIGGGYTPERRLEIMKDSRTGAFGALALIFAVLLKSAALYSLVLGHCWAGMILAPVVSRFAMVLGAYHMPYARSVGGLARPFLEHMDFQQLVGASLLSLVFLVFFSLKFAAIYLGIALACTGLLRLLSRRWLGGITGDVLGALNEITEVVLLAVSACCFCG
jgi:adenosylcobinamide-GDP ribazoletransferase